MGAEGEVTIGNEGGAVKVTDNSVSTPDIAKSPARSRAMRMTREMFKEAFSLYDPDQDESIKPKTISAEELYGRARIPRYVGGGKTGKGVETSIAGTFVVPGSGKAMREANVLGWDQLQKLVRSQAYKGMKLRETHGIKLRGEALRESSLDAFQFGDTTTTGTLQVNDEFTPLLLGPFNRQMYLHDMLDQQSKAYEGMHHNPILKAAINSGVNFVMGDGINVIAANPVCQAEWDAYVERVGKHGPPWQEKMRTFYKDVSTLGESFLTMPETGDGPTLSMWDASTVWEIVTNPRDIDDVYYAYRQFPTQYQIPYATKGNGPPLSEYVIEQVPPARWLQVKINATIGEKRGRSDLFSVLGWGKRFKDWFNAAVVNGQISNAFVLHWSINGGQDDIDAMKDNPDFSQVPAPGSAWFTNNQVVPNLLRPEGGLQGADKTGEQLLAIIAVSMNLPPEYLGVAGTSTRATAIVRGEPAAKFFEVRQQMVREYVKWQFFRVMRSAQLAGRLPKRQPKRAAIRDVVSALRSGDYKRARMYAKAIEHDEQYTALLDTSVEVMMPEVEPADRDARLKSLQAARATNVISHETYSKQYAEGLDIKDYDFDDEQRLISEERERGISGIVPPPAPSNGGKPKAGSSQDDKEYRKQNKERPADQ